MDNSELNDINKINRKDDKIIITFSVIIIFVITIMIIVMLFIYLNGKKKKNDEILQNKLNENSILSESKSENSVISNEVIDDDDSASIDKKYGRVEIVWIDKDNNIIDEPLEPNLGDKLTAVKYSNSSYKFKTVKADEKDWYNYSNKKWANAVDTDENYFVWIPRFAYKITYYKDSDYKEKIGYSDGRGLLKIKDENTLTRIEKKNVGLKETGNHYIVHPAFMKDTASGFRNGGWSDNISGFWTSKYEMSMETNGQNVVTEDKDLGNVLLSDSIKAVSKPTKSVWRNINVGNAYNVAYNFNRDLESHLTKNSEWGAIAYLSYSQYGSDGETIENNESDSYISGNSTNELEVYNNLKKISSNLNETGVYDLSGSASEFVSAFISNGYEKIGFYGGEGKDFLLENISNSKYKTIYSNTQTDDGKGKFNSSFATLNYNLNSRHRGDAIFETSNSGYGTESWNNNSSFFPQQDVPFIIRGGDFAGKQENGLFSFNYANGSFQNNQGFRVILITDK